MYITNIWTVNEVYGVGTDGIETTPNEVYGVSSHPFQGHVYKHVKLKINYYIVHCDCYSSYYAIILFSITIASWDILSAVTF